MIKWLFTWFLRIFYWFFFLFSKCLSSFHSADRWLSYFLFFLASRCILLCYEIFYEIPLSLISKFLIIIKHIIYLFFARLISWFILLYLHINFLTCECPLHSISKLCTFSYNHCWKSTNLNSNFLSFSTNIEKNKWSNNNGTNNKYDCSYSNIFSADSKLINYFLIFTSFISVTFPINNSSILCQWFYIFIRNFNNYWWFFDIDIILYLFNSWT